MKKLALVVSVAVVFLLAACGANAEKKPDDAIPTAECPQADDADATAIRRRSTSGVVIRVSRP